MKTSVVADVMTDHVLTARPAMPLKELARVLTEHDISAMPVLDPDDRVVGIVSERDLLSKQADPLPRHRRWWQRRRTREEIRRAGGDSVGQIMTADPVTITPEKPVSEAARRMIEHEITHLPVIGHDGALVGIVSRKDLLRAYLRTDDEIRDAVLDEVFLHILWIDPTEVDVSVTDGIVTLSGTVSQRSTAEIGERLVHRLDGVVDVISTLGYRIDDGGIAGRPAHHTATRPSASPPASASTT